MFDEKERKERINELMSDTLEAYINNGKKDFLDMMITEEKLMMEQAKKEAREEFAKEL